MNKVIKNNMMDNQNMIENVSNLYTPNEAIYRGTIFKTLDQPYHNYQITDFTQMSEKDKLMLELQAHFLAIHDLTLYLDVYPDNVQAIALRKKYQEAYDKVKNEYNKKYSPFSLSCKEVNTVPFSWSSTPFPWGNN